MTHLSIKGLWKEYDGHVVLENVNLDIGDHEFVTVIGASGCGKTTSCEYCWASVSPTKGRVLLDGRPLPTEPGPERGIDFSAIRCFLICPSGQPPIGPRTTGSPAIGAALRQAAARCARQGRSALGRRGPLRGARQVPAATSGGMSNDCPLAVRDLRAAGPAP